MAVEYDEDDNTDNAKDHEQNNFETFRDVFFTTLVAVTTSTLAVNKSSSHNGGGSVAVYSQKRRKGQAKSTTNRSSKNTSAGEHHNRHAVVVNGGGNDGESDKTVNDKTDRNDPADLADFSEFIAREIFPSLPSDLRTLTHQRLQQSSELADTYSPPLTLTTLEHIAESIPPTVNDNLTAYGLIEPPSSDVQSFMTPILNYYISTVTTPPPKWAATRASACEICDRDWVPLTYHHLIPRGVHGKALKRGWHPESQLNSVAWLCRACHNFVHNMASNEELAREWFTLDRICEREDVARWAMWVGKVRWKKR